MLLSSYYAIKRIGVSFLGNDVRLILGSEWNYSPFAYPSPNPLLIDYVLVGLPASEAQNALLVPIAGHELGHAVWRLGRVGHNLLSTVRAKVVELVRVQWVEAKAHFGSIEPTDIEDDFEAISVWHRSFDLAFRQCEEVFCDLLALYTFGESFAHAFRYLLAPDLGNPVARVSHEL